MRSCRRCGVRKPERALNDQQREKKSSSEKRSWINRERNKKKVSVWSVCTSIKGIALQKKKKINKGWVSILALRIVLNFTLIVSNIQHSKITDQTYQNCIFFSFFFSASGIKMYLLNNNNMTGDTQRKISPIWESGYTCYSPLSFLIKLLLLILGYVLLWWWKQNGWSLRGRSCKRYYKMQKDLNFIDLWKSVLLAKNIWGCNCAWGGDGHHTIWKFSVITPDTRGFMVSFKCVFWNSAFMMLFL